MASNPTNPSRSETRSRSCRDPRLIRAALATVAAAGLFACGAFSRGAATSPETAELPKQKPVCVVLSVGGEDGLAHIGVLEALRGRGIEPRCVYGNSMGSLIGGLYAAAPGADLRLRYRSVMTAYVERTKRETEDAAGLGLLLALLFMPGAAAGEALVGGAIGAGLGQASVYEIDRKRLVDVLDVAFGKKTISELPVDFATWHDEVRGPTLVKVRLNSGSLAKAIGDSIANPLIFQDVNVHGGARLDPGADRVSAVPLDEACRLRPDAHFIVSNVTGHPVYFSAEMKCSYDEIAIDPPKIDARKAFIGEAPDFDRIVSAGFTAAKGAFESGQRRQPSRGEGQR